jgi:serine/threonine-protein kinase
MTLPTEWLWEKAARCRDGRTYPWGPELEAAAQLTNVGAPGTRPVGSYPRTRTPYGCEDLVGNVSEWCQISPAADYGHMPDSLAEAEGTREGSNLYAPVRGACFMRTVSPRHASWHRRQLAYYRRNYWVGFRPALFLPCRPACDTRDL